MKYAKKVHTRRFKKRAGAKLATEAYVKKAINRNLEHKNDYISITNLNGTTAVVSQIAGMDQGVEINERVGLEIVTKKLDLIFALTFSSLNTYGDAVRYVVVRDNEAPTSTAPTWADVFQAADAYSPYEMNTETRKRFTVLLDKIVNNPNDGAYRCIKHHTINLKDKKMFFIGSDAADVSSGGLWLMACALENTNKTTMAGLGTLVFTDA